MDDNKNIIDKFLDYYDESSKDKLSKVVYTYPSKFKCIVGFIFCTIFLLFTLSLFSFSLLFLFMLIIALIMELYYGLNLFTKKGFGIPKRVPLTQEEIDELMKDNKEE